MIPVVGVDEPTVYIVYIIVLTWTDTTDVFVTLKHRHRPFFSDTEECPE